MHIQKGNVMIYRINGRKIEVKPGDALIMITKERIEGKFSQTIRTKWVVKETYRHHCLATRPAQLGIIKTCFSVWELANDCERIVPGEA